MHTTTSVSRSLNILYLMFKL